MIRLKNYKTIFAIFIFSRIFFYVVAFILKSKKNINFTSQIFCQYDCHWYLTIIKDGYMDTVLTQGHIGAANWAFFPVFPIFVKTLATMFSFDPLLTGILLNNLLFIGFLILTNEYLRNKFNNFDESTFTFLYCFSPFSIYFNSLYTETTYIFFIALFLFLQQKNRFLLAGIAGAFLSGTRVTGIMLLLVQVFTVLKFRIQNSLSNTKSVFSILVFPLGLILFALYLYFHTGNALAFFSIQKAWGYGESNFLEWLIRIPKENSLTLWLELLSIVLAIFGSVYFLSKKSYEEAYILLIPVITSVLSAIINFRFFYILYPFYLIVSRFLANRRIARNISFALCLFSLVFSINGWIDGAGYLV